MTEDELDSLFENFEQLRVENKVENRKICLCPDGICEEYEDWKNGCVICYNCGLVLESKIVDCSAEWRNFDSEDGGPNNKSKDRCGPAANSLFPKSELRTIISGSGKLAKMNMWNSMPYEEKVLWDVMNLMKNKTAGASGITSTIVNVSLHLFKQLTKKDEDGKKEIHRGQVRNGLIAVCLYQACKTMNMDRTLADIAGIMDIPVKIIVKCRKLYAEMTQGNKNMKTTTPKDLVTRFINKLDIPYKTNGVCCKIITELENLNIVKQNTPQSIAAGVLFFVCQEMSIIVDKYMMLEVCGVSSATTTKVAKKICEYKQEIFCEIKNKK